MAQIWESEFADEYQDWLDGHPGATRGGWFEVPLTSFAAKAPLCVDAAMTVQEAARRMTLTHSGAALVFDREEMCGILTDSDVRRAVGSGLSLDQMSVERVMSPRPETLPQWATLAQAMRLMARTGFHQIPLVDERGAPVQLVCMRDVAAYVGETFPREILNAPPARPHDVTPLYGG